MARLSINVSDEVSQALRDLADKYDVSVTEIVRRAVSAYKYIEDVRSDGHQMAVIRDGQIRELSFIPMV